MFSVLLILFAILGASNSTVSGWADVLEAVYNDIGGCSSYIFYFLTFCLMFLTLNLLLGRLRHHLKNVNYFKLLQMNLEQQCMVCFFSHFLSYYSTMLVADFHLDRATISWRPLRSVARGRKKVDLLNKEANGAKAAEQLAAERTLKAIEAANSLLKEVDAERESGAPLKAQVDMLSKRLEDVKSIGQAAAKLYVGALEQFGGSTPPLPSKPSAFNIFS